MRGERFADLIVIVLLPLAGIALAVILTLLVISI